MIAPRWVSVLSQPIAISDLLSYLIAAIDVEVSESRVFEIGGADQVSYGDLMREYARQRGLRRLIIPVPVLTPRLSSLWLGLVTPLYARVGRKLIDSICHPTIVRDQTAATTFAIAPLGYSEAIRAALRNEDRECAESRWSDAISSTGATTSASGAPIGSRFVDSRTVEVHATPAASLCRGGEDWRSDGLVFHQLALGAAGMDGSGRRWHWHASRAATSRAAASGRYARLLAR